MKPQFEGTHLGTYHTMKGWLKLQQLTAHNLQNWINIFLRCHCYRIYSVEAAGLKSSNNTLRIKIFVTMWNLGQFHEKVIFCQYQVSAYLKFKSKNSFAQM